MILLDTNVVSALIGPGTTDVVLDWVDSYPIETLYLSATILSELRLGIALLPAGRRQRDLSGDLDVLLTSYFDGRILPFDRSAADLYARLVSVARIKGQSLAMADGQIAAVASLHGFSVATRDTAPFLAAGLPIIDPWHHQA